MWCWQARRRTDEVLGGLCTPAHRAQLARHLESCPDCRARAERDFQLRHCLSRWPRESPTVGIRDRVLAAIANEAAPVRSPGIRRPAIGRQVFTLGAPAVLLLAVLAGLLADRTGKQSPEETALYIREASAPAAVPPEEADGKSRVAMAVPAEKPFEAREVPVETMLVYLANDGRIRSLPVSQRGALMKAFLAQSDGHGPTMTVSGVSEP